MKKTREKNGRLCYPYAMTNETFEIELTAMAHGGSALGRHDKRTIFIPYTIPGEIVEARITEDKGRIAFAEGIRLIDASADRVYPRCPHFGPGKCGRCQWQHIDYAAQLLLKQDVLADQLARIGGFEDADVRAMIPSPAQWGYNYHMTLLADEAGHLGLPGFDGRPPFSFQECHIIHPDLLNLYYQIDLEFDQIPELRLQLSTDGAHMLILRVNNEDDVPELTADLPTSVNMILPDNEPVNLIGDSHSVYTIGGRTFRVTAGSEFRANVAQVETLAALVVQLADLPAGANVLDLYAGVGVFSAALAPQAGLITLVESYPPAVTDADVNLADFDHIDVIEGSVEDVLDSLEVEYFAAVVDPPSEGLSIEAVDLLAASSIRRLVYVSSDPATLARDAKRLVRHGFRLGIVQPIDLAPQTYWIDSAAIFER